MLVGTGAEGLRTASVDRVGASVFDLAAVGVGAMVDGGDGRWPSSGFPFLKMTRMRCADSRP